MGVFISNEMLELCYIHLRGVFGGEGGGVWSCRGKGWVELGDGNGPLPGQDGRWIWSSGVGWRWDRDGLMRGWAQSAELVGQSMVMWCVWERVSGKFEYDRRWWCGRQW